MPFIEQEAKSEVKIIEGKKTKVITPEIEITLTNMQQDRSICQMQKQITM